MSHPRERLARLDRKLGTLWSRFWGGVLGFAGLAALASAFSAEDFTFGEYWPVIAVAGCFLLFSILLLRSRKGLGETLDETPSTRPHRRR